MFVRILLWKATTTIGLVRRRLKQQPAGKINSIFIHFLFIVTAFHFYYLAAFFTRAHLFEPIGRDSTHRPTDRLTTNSTIVGWLDGWMTTEAQLSLLQLTWGNERCANGFRFFTVQSSSWQGHSTSSWSLSVLMVFLWRFVEFRVSFPVMDIWTYSSCFLCRNPCQESIIVARDKYSIFWYDWRGINQNGIL